MPCDGSGDMNDVTLLLDRVQAGDPRAADELLPIVYEELRKLAAARMSALPPGQTLQATALVHEAWLRLSGPENHEWDNRGHFFAAAAEAMRRILVDRARQKSSQKRGGGVVHIDLDNVDIAMESNEELVLALDEALSRYAQRDPQGAELIKLRFFVGLPNQQAAALLGIPERTAKRTWAFARAWLYHEIQQGHQK
jgi:RNA polymerase sigma factor (TIGR02999 family)